MRKNTREVYAAWQERRTLQLCEAIHTNGDHIYSYGTCIVARRKDDVPVFNLTRYSLTTSIHQNALALLMSGTLPSHPQVVPCRIVSDMPRGVEAYQMIAHA